MRNLIFLLAALQISCSTMFEEIDYVSVPVELRENYDLFFHEARIRGVDLQEVPVILKVVDSVVVDGVDRVAASSPGNHHIRFHKYKYFKLNAMYREYVMFHELGHYVLGLNHYDTLKSGRVYSIMNGNGNGNGYAYFHGMTEEDRTRLLDELFGVLN